jgi:hypothetical protein
MVASPMNFKIITASFENARGEWGNVYYGEDDFMTAFLLFDI